MPTTGTWATEGRKPTADGLRLRARTAQNPRDSRNDPSKRTTRPLRVGYLPIVAMGGEGRSGIGSDRSVFPEPAQGDDINGFASFPLQSAAFVGLGVSVAFWCASCAGGQDSMTSCIRGSNECCVLCAVCWVLGVGCRGVVRGALFLFFIFSNLSRHAVQTVSKHVSRGTKWVTQIPAAVKMSVQLGRRLHADFHKSAGGLGIVNTPAVRP